MQRLVETLEPVTGDPLLVGAWDFSRRIGSDDIVDLSANNLRGVVKQLPMRAATGANWNGYTQSWTEAPGNMARFISMKTISKTRTGSRRAN